MTEKKIFDNSPLFKLYGIVNVFLVLMLLTLLVLFFNDVEVINRTGFVIFISIHIIFLFFIKVHYLCIIYDEENKRIEFHYNRTFGIRWRQKARTVLLPIKQFHGYQISRDQLGLVQISFFKLQDREKYELGPFHVAILTNYDKLQLQNTFGETL